MRAAIYIFALALMICVRAQNYPARSKSRLPGALATSKLENALLSHGGSRTSVVKESVLLDIRGGAIEASQIGSSLSFPQMKFLLQVSGVSSFTYPKVSFTMMMSKLDSFVRFQCPLLDTSPQQQDIFYE